MRPRRCVLRHSTCHAGTEEAMKLRDCQCVCLKTPFIGSPYPFPSPAMNLPAMYCPKLNEEVCSTLPKISRINPATMEPLRPSMLLKKMSMAAPTRQPRFHVPTTAPAICGTSIVGYAFSKEVIKTRPPMSPCPYPNALHQSSIRRMHYHPNSKDERLTQSRAQRQQQWHSSNPAH